MFGQDGTGGYSAFWLIHPEKALEEQPIVFLGSEGERGIIATNLDEYLWLLVAGIGPYEAMAYPDLTRKPKPHFVEFARKNSRVSMLSVEEIILRASAAYP